MDFNPEGTNREESAKPSGSSRAVVVAVLIVAALVMAYLAFSLFVLQGKTVLPNTRAAGVDVGGMTAGKAEMALRAALESPVTVPLAFPDFTRTVTSGDAGATWDCAAGAQRALAYGRENGILAAGWNYLRALAAGGRSSPGVSENCRMRFRTAFPSVTRSAITVEPSMGTRS